MSTDLINQIEQVELEQERINNEAILKCHSMQNLRGIPQKIDNDFLQRYHDTIGMTIDHELVIKGNIELWTVNLDYFLKDFVILYNFNFFDVATRFHDFIALPYKYDFSEGECRRHWAFLHAARSKKLVIDDDYYTCIKSRRIKPSLLVENDEEKDIEIELNKNNSIKIDTKEIKEEEIIKNNDKEEENAIDEIDELIVDKKITDKEIKEMQNMIYKKEEEIEEDNTSDIVKTEHDDFIDSLFDVKVDLKIGDNGIKNLTEAFSDKKTTSNSDEMVTKNKNHDYFPVNISTNKFNLDDDDENEEVNNNYVKDEKPNLEINEQELASKTKNMKEFIEDTPELKKQATNLETYCNFTVKSLKYFLPKIIDEKVTDESVSKASLTCNLNKTFEEYEEKHIKQASKEINDLIFNTLKKNNEDEINGINSRSINIDDRQDVTNINTEQETTLNKDYYKEMLSKNSTNELIQNPEFLQKIVDIINNSKLRQIADRNEKASQEEESLGQEIEVNTNIKGDSDEKNKSKLTMYRGVMCTTENTTKNKLNDSNDDYRNDLEDDNDSYNSN